MAVYTYSSTNTNFSTFDVWSNAGFTDDTNITLSTVLTDAYPAASNPSGVGEIYNRSCLLYTSPSPRDRQKSRMPSSA